MSCRDICVSMDYDQTNDFYSERTRRAAKPHVCCECGEAIAVGQSYEVVTGKSDGDLWTQRTCLPCVEVHKAFCCGSCTFGDLWKSVREQMFPEWNELTAIDCLAELDTDAAIAKVRHAYAAYQHDTDRAPSSEGTSR